MSILLLRALNRSLEMVPANNSSSKNGEWLSVCNTFSEAKTLAMGKGRGKTKSCYHCFKSGERFIL